MAGLLTRVAALFSMGFSVLLMAMFGWQGATCIDEWTMAACNLAMGATPAARRQRRLLARQRPASSQSRPGRKTVVSLDVGQPAAAAQRTIAFRKLAFAVLAFVVVFDVGTYNYYRGSVVTPFHGGPVSPTKHHLTLSDADLLPDGGVRFHVYLDAGTPEAPVHVVAADLLNSDKQSVAHWDAAALSELPKTDFANDYAYNKFAPGPFGIRAPMGAAATVTLPPPASGTNRRCEIHPADGCGRPDLLRDPGQQTLGQCRAGCRRRHPADRRSRARTSQPVRFGPVP